jgi:excisionase family DNA binding protein
MFENHDDIRTIEQLMEVFFIGKNTTYELINTGEISAFKIGKTRKFSFGASEIILNSTFAPIK